MTGADFATRAMSPNEPARLLVAITFDTEPTQGLLRGVYNGATTADDIAVTLMNGDAIVIPKVPSGTVFWVWCKKVNTTGTTALAAELLGII